MILRVRFHDEPLAPSPFDEAEGAGAHGLSVELGRVEVDALEQVLGDDAGPRVHEHGEKGSVRIAQTKAHRVIVEHLDRLLGEVVRPGETSGVGGEDSLGATLHGCLRSALAFLMRNGLV